MDELKKCLSHIFIYGSKRLSEKDFIFFISMELRWLSPKDAKRLLDIALENELLSLESGKLKPNFDYKEIDVPTDYRPSKNILIPSPPEKLEKNILSTIVDEIAAHTSIEKKELFSMINKKRERMNIGIEVAALLVGMEEGITLSKYIDEVMDVTIEKAKDMVDSSYSSSSSSSSSNGLRERKIKWY
jgi:hypothetical protein